MCNVGSRQSGRLTITKLFDVSFDGKNIVYKTNTILNFRKLSDGNVYYKTEPAKTIIRIIKNND